MNDGVIVFANVPEAVGWAEERLSRVGVKNIFGAAIAKRGTGRFPPHELQDFAHTVSLVVAQVRPVWCSDLVRYVYGIPTKLRQYSLAMELVEAAIQARPEFERKDRERLNLLALGMLIEFRARVRDGRRPRVKNLTKIMGISRPAFYQGWVKAMNEFDQILEAWLPIGESQVFASLGMKGMMA